MATVSRHSDYQILANDDFRAIDVRLLHAGAFEVPVAASNAVIAATATELREKSTTLMIVVA
jgi:hypothetical protein